MFVDEQFCLPLRQNWVLLPLKNLHPRVLAFQRDKSRFKWSSITLDIVKNHKRGRTVTIQYQDGNSSTVTVQCLLMSNFVCLRGRTGFSFLQRTWSLVS